MERKQKKVYQRPVADELVMDGDLSLLAGSIKRESYRKAKELPSSEPGYEEDNDPFNNN